MGITRIDYANWPRRELFEYFRGTVMYLNLKLDVAHLLEAARPQGIRFYPAMLYCIGRVVNENTDYRHGYDEEGQVGIWDAVRLLYTVPRRENPELFSMAVTSWQEDFGQFYKSFLEDSARAECCGRLFSDQPGPDCMGITSAPGVHFDSFAFGGGEAKTDLTPFVVMGKYQREGNRVLLPVCGEFVHAVNDGYHISRFFQLLEQAVEQLAQELR